MQFFNKKLLLTLFLYINFARVNFIIANIKWAKFGS